MNLSWAVFATLSLSYVASFSLMTGFIAPLQKIVAPDVSILSSLLFLPHGVRVLAFYFYGWRGFVYLTPPAVSMWALAVYGIDVPLHFAGTAVSLIATYFGVRIVRAIYAEPVQSVGLFSWRHLMLAGLIASIGNSYGLAVLHQSQMTLSLILSYIIGDVSGQMAMMLLLIAVFRGAERLVQATAGKG